MKTHEFLSDGCNRHAFRRRDQKDPTVFVLDNELATREFLSELFHSVGLPSECHTTGQAFLDAYGPERRGCLVMEIRLPGIGGLELQAQLNASSIRIPIIMLTGCGDVPTAVRAMKQGAIDFIEKPCSSVALLEVVRYALQKDTENHNRGLQRNEMRKRVGRLTPRERQVMQLVVSGLPNKQIAGELGVAIKTVEAHRAHVMRKTQAESVPELVHLAHGGEL